MEPEQFIDLVIKYINNAISSEELDRLNAAIAQGEHDTLFKSYVEANYVADHQWREFDTETAKRELLDLIQREKSQERKRKLRNYTYAAAASLALLMSLGYYWIQKDSTSERITQPTIVNNQIEAGSDKATLTLENGEQILLAKGQEYQTDHVRSNGEALTYEAKTSNDITYNYLTVPRGGQYQIKLSDGTRVWLNSETQLKYPVAFVPGQAREVELLHGEAYFDVSPSTAHNGTRFRVLHDRQDIEVLGTEFNINAYKDEQNIYTTLVEGSIALEAPNTANERTLLTPGQQANLDTANRTVSLGPVEVYDQISWKEGVFSFERKSLRDIMKVLARWYDMEVVFVDQELETIPFTGSYNKDRSIEDILETIQNTGFISSYWIHNKTVTLE